MSGLKSKKEFKVVIVAGARPNFMKIAPVVKEMEKFPEIEVLIVHTGQHYDKEMSRHFFEELEIPEPYVNLEVGSASHAVQTAEIMKRFEKVVVKERPDMVVVVGDVNSTIACALVASKLEIKVAHVEAGLRSFDRTMPEEINRLLTDAISDLLLTTEKSANKNLKSEGIDEDKIFFVGNVMIDTLLSLKEHARSIKPLKLLGLDTQVNIYALLTLHRPSNVDNKETLQDIMSALCEIAKTVPILFPCHPRTQEKMEGFGLNKYFKGKDGKGIYLLNPLSYLEFLSLMLDTKLVITDSGGIQEETTIIGVPCITVRENTERPVTISEGTNVLVGGDRKRLIAEGLKAIKSSSVTTKVPELWDGKASQRIVKVILDCLRSSI